MLSKEEGIPEADKGENPRDSWKLAYKTVLNERKLREKKNNHRIQRMSELERTSENIPFSSSQPLPWSLYDSEAHIA